MAEKPNKFETVDLATFYQKNGSEFSSIRPVNTPPEKVGVQGVPSDQTPVSKLAEMVSPPNPMEPTPEKPHYLSMASFPPTPEKTGIQVSTLANTPEKTTQQVFPMPVSPPKVGIEPNAFTFSPAFVGMDVSAFSFVPGFTGTDTTPFSFVPGFTPAELSIHNGTPDINATGFTKEMNSTQFTGISGNAFSSDSPASQLKIQNLSPDIDSTGFTKEMKSTQFTGISGTEFSSPKLSTQLKIHNGIADIDMVGFTDRKGHFGNPGGTDFTGVTGDPGTMTYKMATDNPGGTYAWTRTIYNDSITAATNNIEDIAATGFIKYDKGQYRGGVSSFIGMAEGEDNGNTYEYPVDKAFPFGSYNFNSLMQQEVGIGIPQQFKALARSGPGVDTNIQAKKSQFFSGDFESKIKKQYLEIPGKGETNLRKESTNFHSFGNATDQPFIIRDIGKNWSLFSDGPGPKFGIDLVRGGVGTAINRSLIDALRIGKFLISPKGLLYLVKEIGLQLTNPKMQIDPLLGIGSNRVYPLGLSTLAQTLTNAFGIHFVRHGLGPLNGQLDNKSRYENNIFQAEAAGGLAAGAAGKAATKDLKIDTSAVSGDVPPSAPADETPMGSGNPRSNSRLVFLASDLQSGLFGLTADTATSPLAAGSGLLNALSDPGAFVQNTVSANIPGYSRGMTKVKITRLSDKNFFGPHSVYGIGGTSIFRSVVGIGIGQHEETGGTYADSKDMSKNGQDVFFKQVKGDPVTTNPSVAKTYYTSDDGSRYSDQFGSNVSNLANQPGKDDAPSPAYDQMLDTDPANPFKSKLAMMNEGVDGEIDARTATDFIHGNETLHDDMGIHNKYLKYGDIHDVGDYGSMVDPESGFQSKLVQKFDGASVDEINAPDKLAKIDPETPDADISNEATLRSYEVLTYGKLPTMDETPRLASNGKLMDFRERLDGTNKNFERPNGGDSEGPAWGGKDIATRFGGDYGRILRINDGDSTGAGQRVDRSSWEDAEPTGLFDKSIDISDPENPDYNAEFDDLIRVKFNTIDPDNDQAEALQFRAYLTSLEDNVNPSWQDVTYVGRTTPTYLFQSMDRDISFELKLVAGTREELIANYKRLNRFIQLISPEYKDGLPVAPMLKFTLGDWFVGIPMIIDSFSMAPSEGAPWELADGRQLPHYLDLSIGGKILFADAKTDDDKVTQALFSRDANYFGAVSRDFAASGIYTPVE